MNKSKKTTFIKMLESNLLFLKSIKKEHSLYLDSNIYFELLMLYINLHQNYLNKLSHQEKDLLKKLNCTKDYFISETTIFVDNTEINLDDLQRIILNLDQVIYEETTAKTLKLAGDATAVYIPQNNNSKCIYFSVHEISKQKKLESRRLLSEENVLNSQTLKYSQDVADNFKLNLRKLIINILTSKTKDIDYTELLFLYFIINTHTVLDFYGTEKNIPTDTINYNPNVINISRLKYDNPSILSLERKVLATELKSKRIEERKNFFLKYSPNLKKSIKECDELLTDLYNELTVDYLELHDLRTDPEEFPKYLIANMISCFNELHIELQSYPSDPYVTFFSVKGNRINCFFELHLSTLVNLINNSTLIEKLNQNMTLKKQINFQIS